MGFLVQELRQAVKAAQLTQKEIAQAAMIDPANISRFLNGQGALSLEAAEKLAFALNLTLVPDRAADKNPLVRQAKQGRLYSVASYLSCRDEVEEMTEHEREAWFKARAQPEPEIQI